MRGLWFVAILLIVLWVIGRAANVGAIIWLLLIAGLAVLIFNLIALGRSGRRR